MCAVCMLQSDMASSCLVLKSAMCKLIDPDLHTVIQARFMAGHLTEVMYFQQRKKVLLSFNVSHVENIVLLETSHFVMQYD